MTHALHDLVPLDTIPGLHVDLRYGTPDNVAGRVLYPRPSAWLQRTVAMRLAAAQRQAEAAGLGLLVWDAYRPLSVQRDLWAVMPDERYVANPATGSNHNRGAAVDLTLCTPDGTPIPMPTGFDDFTERAHRVSRDAPAEVLGNRDLLEAIMGTAGWVPLPTEWWHYDAPDASRYPVLDLPLDTLPRA